MTPLIEWLRTASFPEAAAVLLAENVLLFGLALGVGNWAVRRFAERRVALPADPLTHSERSVAARVVCENTLTTLAGLWLWRRGIIEFRTDAGLWAALDVAVLVLAMDFAMYVLHRLVHYRLWYPFVHRLHHDYVRVRPLTLFILHPLENLAFGGLFLLAVSLYTSSWLGVSIYLAINLAWGTLGHLGVEPFPDAWSRRPLLQWIAGSTFHARHHQDVTHNFGFYTLIWDRLFGTLRPDYHATYGRLPDWVAAEAPAHAPASQRHA